MLLVAPHLQNLASQTPPEGPTVAVSQSRLKIEYNFADSGLPSRSAQAFKPKASNENPFPFDMWHSSKPGTETQPTAISDSLARYETEWIDEAEEEANYEPPAEPLQLNAIGLPLADIDENDEELYEDTPGLTVTLSPGNPSSNVTFDIPIDEKGLGDKAVTEKEVRDEEESNKKYTIADGPTTKQSEVCDFHVALMVFVTSCDISQKQYIGL